MADYGEIQAEARRLIESARASRLPSRAQAFALLIAAAWFARADGLSDEEAHDILDAWLDGGERN